MKETEEKLKGFYCAANAASSETDLPSGLVRTSCCEPADMAAVVRISVFLSLSVTDTDLPPKVAVMPFWKPLQIPERQKRFRRSRLPQSDQEFATR